MNEFGHECWIVETSKDGERWRFFGKAWKEPGEALLLHAVPRYVRVRPDGDPEWREPLESSDDMPITLLRVEEGVREELWPDAAHVGLPMLLPGGEIGRLLRFEHDDALGRWTYALEFRGLTTMTDWATAASLATAIGTLILAIATFVAVRAANRAARVAEYSMQIGIRPLLIPSRLEDSIQKVMWPDQHWIELTGAGASVEEIEGDILMAMSLRNAGSGIAVLHGWHLVLTELRDPHPHAEPEEFRRQIRDLYVAGSDIGFWQGAVRDHDDPEYAELVDAVRTRRMFAVELLYSDHEGGQRAVTRVAFAPTGGSAWMCSMVRHWNLDRPDPRDAS